MQLSIANQQDDGIFPLIHFDANDATTLFSNAALTTPISTFVTGTNVRGLKSKGSISNVNIVMNADNMATTMENDRNGKRSINFNLAHGIWSPATVLNDRGTTGATMIWVGRNNANTVMSGMFWNAFVSPTDTQYTACLSGIIHTKSNNTISCGWGGSMFNSSNVDNRMIKTFVMGTTAILVAEAAPSIGCRLRLRRSGTDTTLDTAVTKPYEPDFFSRIKSTRLYNCDVGADKYYVNQIFHEFLVYSGVLTDSQMNTIINNLVTKWGL